MKKTTEEIFPQLSQQGKLKTGGKRRPKTIGRKQLLQEFPLQEIEPDVLEELETSRPKYRYQCRNGFRPCIYLSCKYHLFIDVNPKSGSIKFNFPDQEVWELEETCALDIAERGGMTLEELGKMFNLTRERIRQYERAGLDKLRETLGEDFDVFFPDSDF